MLATFNEQFLLGETQFLLLPHYLSRLVPNALNTAFHVTLKEDGCKESLVRETVSIQTTR